MVTQKDIQDVVKAVNEVLLGMDERLKKLEEAAKPSTTTSKKSKEKT